MSDSNRLLKLFSDENRKRDKFFMPFLVAGDPNINEFKNLIEKIEPHVDILEIGVPFSDPIADGPTIQEANVRAFNAGINTKVALEAIKDIRAKTEKPIVILTYYNILIQGADTIEESLDKTFKNLKECGVDGIVVGDLPIEEAGLALKASNKYNICLIFLIAPSTTEERLENILKIARGFIYLISVMGVTGARDMVAQITKDTIKRMKKKTEKVLPVFVGFGISKPKHAKAIIDAGADGIIIGSAIVNIVKKNLNDYEKMEAEMVKFVSRIKDVIKRK
ncbi:MAG: Tryptophan synthase alpha chain [Candidatus Lokiarchaeum sp. GC14_75]|nr:MAG: Tryptophan synthase alpha chain [Candidatus Lokiarchaeum sp. GC14_75]